MREINVSFVTVWGSFDEAGLSGEKKPGKTRLKKKH